MTRRVEGAFASGESGNAGYRWESTGVHVTGSHRAGGVVEYAAALGTADPLLLPGGFHAGMYEGGLLDPGSAHRDSGSGARRRGGKSAVARDPSQVPREVSTAVYASVGHR